MIRSQDIEWMDNPAVDPAQLRGALGELELINRALNGYALSLEGVERLLAGAGIARLQKRGRISFLDVGCGRGDTLRRIADWARQRGQAIQAVGIELSDVSVDEARAACAGYPEISIARRDLFDLDPRRERFDIVHAAMMLHHMTGEADVLAALGRMAALARLGVVINDLHRHAFARIAVDILMRLFSRNPLVRHDAPVSVARGFTRNELRAAARAAGLTPHVIGWRWPFRWLLVWDGVRRNNKH